MFKRLLVPVDGTELAGRAMRTAVDLAQQLGAAITAFIAETPAPPPSPGYGTARYLRDAREHDEDRARHADGVLTEFGRLAAAAGVEFDGIFAQTERIDEAIAEAAQSKACDMIVMVTHGRGAFGELMFGSHTKRVMARTKVPLLVVH